MVHSYKYMKQKVLFFFDLREREEFDDNVIIIQTKKQGAKKYIYSILEKELYKCTSIIIIKVPLLNRCSLPNLIVKDYADRKSIDSFLNDISDFHEVWLCLKANVSDFVSGRMGVNWESGMETQMVEIINGDYPRNLEFINIHSKDFYVYTRFRWNMHYEIRAELSRSQRIRNGYILKAIERKREQLELFCDYASKIGLFSVSVDFLFCKDKLEIIDWDSDNNSLFLEELKI